MAKKDTVFIDVQTSDGGSMQRVAVSAKKLGIALDDAGKASGKTGKSARTLDRNLKGTADMTSNATKGFSKMAQGMTGTLVPAYAVLASNVFAITAAFQFLRQAADFRVMQDSQIAFTGATGVGMQSLTKNIQDASGAMLDFKSAGEAAAIGIASGLGSGQIEALAAGAGNLSKILGRDVTDSFNRLVRGVTKAEPELLDELGITLRLADAQENYAAKLGKSAKDLTNYEKKQAVFAEVQGQLESKYNQVAKATDVQANAIAKLGVAFDKVTKILKGWINVISEPVAEFFTKNVKSLAAALALLAIPIIRAIIPGLDNWKQKSQESAAAAGLAYKEAKEELEKLEQQQKDMAAGKPITGGITTQSAGLKAAGGDINKLEKKQAAALLRNATRENKRLKNLSDKQLSTYRIMLKSKLRGHTTWVEEIILQYNNMGQRMDVSNKKMVANWRIAMATMQSVAAKFTRGVDLLFKGMGLVGIVLMIKDLGTEILRMMGFFSENEGLNEVLSALNAINESMKGVNKEFQDFEKIQGKIRDNAAKGGRPRDLLGELSSEGRFFESFGAQILEASRAQRELSKDLAKAIPASQRLDATEQKRLATLKKIVDTTRASRGQTKFRTNTAEGQAANAAARAGTGPSLRELSKELKELQGQSTAFNKFHAEGMKKSEEETGKLNARTKELASTQLSYLRSLKGSELSAYQKDMIVLLTAIEKTGEMTETQAENFQKLNDKLVEFGDRARSVAEDLRALETSYNTAVAGVTAYKTSYTDLLTELGKTQTELQGILADVAKGGKLPAQYQGNSSQLNNDIKLLGERITLIEKLEDIEIKFSTKKLKIERDALRTAIGRTKLETESIQRNKQILLNNNEIAKINAQLLLDKEKEITLDEKKKEELIAQRDIIDAQNAALNRQADATARIIDAGRQGFETGLQGSISALLKGEESSIKDAMLGIMKSVTDSMIDAFSKNLTEKIMGFIPGFQTQEQKMKTAIKTGHTEGGEEAAKKQKEAIDQATTKFATAINEAADRFAAAIRDACSSSACMGHGGDGGGSTAATVATTVADAVTPSPTATAEPVFEESFKEKMDRLAVTRDLQLQDTQRAAEAAGLVSENLEKAAEETGEGGGFRGFFRKLIGSSGGDVATEQTVGDIVPEGEAGAGLENVVAKGKKGTGLKGLFSNFTSNFGAIFDKNTEGGLLSKMGNLFGGLGSDLGGIFSTLTDGLGSLFSGGGGGILSLFGFASGGYTSKMRDYSTGGVAKGPRSGYPALLHGNEAVVPLPDGKSIPVTMPKTSAGGMQNNVGVTVNIDNQGGVSTDTQSDSQQATEIGERIAQLVQEELLNQKRNGGILSPFGVA